MTKMKLPKVLWDDCLELEAYIHSDTSLDIFELYIMTPETNISGETSDITNFCEFGWYQWVYFIDTYVTSLGKSSSLEVSICPTSVLGPQYLPRTNFYPGKVTYVSIQ